MEKDRLGSDMPRNSGQAVQTPEREADRVIVAKPAFTLLERARQTAQLLGVLNESKNLGKAVYDVPRMVTWAAVPPEIVSNAERVAFRASRDKLANSYVRKMKSLFRKAKTAGVQAVEGDLRLLIKDAFEKSRKLGFSTIGRAGAWDKYDLSTIQRAAEEEFTHTKKFLDDYMADRGRMPYDRRFGQYGNTVNHQFNMAAYEGLPKGTLVFWEMTSFEPCPDCPELSARSPYTTDLGNNPLPTVPQAGDTQCVGDCKCYLRYEFKEFHLGTEPHMSYEVDQYESKAVDAAWLKSKRGKLVERDLTRMYRREAHHRQMMDAYPHGTEEWKFHKKLRDQWNGKLKDYMGNRGIRAVPRANISEYLKPVEGLKTKGFKVVVRESEYTGDAAIIRGLSLTVGEAKSISQASVKMKLADGKVKNLSHGDKAGASLWVKE